MRVGSAVAAAILVIALCGSVALAASPVIGVPPEDQAEWQNVLRMKRDLAAQRVLAEQTANPRAEDLAEQANFLKQKQDLASQRAKAVAQGDQAARAKAEAAEERANVLKWHQELARQRARAGR